jgi:PAS domain S-box-containing protein
VTTATIEHAKRAGPRATWRRGDSAPAGWRRGGTATRATLVDWVEHAGDPMIAVDRHGRLLLANPAFSRAFAMDASRMADLTIDRLVPLLAAPRLGRWLDEGAASPARVHRLLSEACAADGERFLVAVTVLRVRDAGPRDAAAVLALRPLDAPRGIVSPPSCSAGTQRGTGADTVAIGPLLDAVCRSLDDVDARRRCRLAPHDPGARIAADPEVARDVLLRVVDNACRHGGAEGPVTLRTRIEACEPAGAPPGAAAAEHVVVTVADRGPGFTRSQLQRAFEPFGRGAAGHGGTGVSLAVARELLESQLGWIELRSTAGVGTEVDVWLPAAPGAEGG